MYHSFLIHSSADGHLGCFHVLAIVNSAVMNTGVHVSLSDLVSLVCMPRSGIAISIPWKTAKGTCNSSLLKKTKNISKEDRTVKLPEKWQKVVEQNIMLFNKVLSEDEKCVFYFNLSQRKFLANPILAD